MPLSFETKSDLSKFPKTNACNLWELKMQILECFSIARGHIILFFPEVWTMAGSISDYPRMEGERMGPSEGEDGEGANSHHAVTLSASRLEG